MFNFTLPAHQSVSSLETCFRGVALRLPSTGLAVWTSSQGFEFSHLALSVFKEQDRSSLEATVVVVCVHRPTTMSKNLSPANCRRHRPRSLVTPFRYSTSSVYRRGQVAPGFQCSGTEHLTSAPFCFLWRLVCRTRVIVVAFPADRQS